MQAPYCVEVTIQGNAPLLLHRYDSDVVDAKSKAPKGSKIKKTDNLESCVYRTEDGEIGIPGTYLAAAICIAAKSQQDPRSPRKSAMDLFKAAVIPLTEIATLGAKDWDLVDRRPVIVNRARITRERPCFRPGWRATFLFQILSPEYIVPDMLYQCIYDAGKLIGIGDFRPTFGRFQPVHFEVLEDAPTL
jgi:hypothetical protein